jgi:alkylated DNA repair dioxygenase AlkB
LRYEPEFLTPAQESALLDAIAGTDWSEVRMHGVIAKRRVAHYGWRYEYLSWQLEEGPPIPEYLQAVRSRLAKWAGVADDDLGEALVTEYPPGAGIGWHRDAPQFGIVAAVSLGGACRMRFRLQQDPAGEKREIELLPRSAYLIDGPARSQWQHHIPPTRELRYSITFRTLRKRPRNDTG